MTFPISQLQPNNSTFSDWLNVTNQLANVSSTVMITVDSADPQVGNVVIDGSIQANTVYATTISGGEIGSEQSLLFNTAVVFSSNVAFVGGSTNLGAASNLLVSGANSSNFILAANTSTGRLRYTAIDSNYINTLDINADRLITGTVPNGRLNGTYTNLTGTGDLNAGSISTGFGNINIGTNTFTGNGSGLNSLNASNITTGTVADARIPNLDTAKITSGTFVDARIPNLNASKITTGTLDDARLPSTMSAKSFTGALTMSITQPLFLYNSASNNQASILANSSGDIIFNMGVSTTVGLRYTFGSTGNFTAVGNVTAFSDIKLKTDVLTINNALDLIDEMRGVRYTRIDNGDRGIGVIAQEIQQVVPEVVIKGEEYLSVAYGNLAGVFIEAIKELREENRMLKSRLSALEAK